MKKVALGFLLVLAALGLTTSPAMAAPTVSAADQAFLAALAAPVAPTPAAKRPAIGGKALCTASANCGPGGTISCSGNNSTTSCSATDQSCPGQRGSVTCDGVTTQCPNACPPCDSNLNCSVERSNCAADCSPCAFTFSCSTVTCVVTCHCKFSTCF
jgi:hypothetical protein